ncbi:hypothetical protein JOY44_15525 [Phormidium sp. CLA17]|uniref:hypothetical protein n=1 Tax=Leptolyngbya sp. Cla-17 TaxID=2803751 RepID=UPI001492EF7B|nr:hypothetical protein [Leptolyngbya sp. Cla-17]MBM0742999.1 hypothetical protein [Leptolyngbya sp. Cla-17]
MNAPTLTATPLEEIVERILATRQITRVDQHSLLTLSNLNAKEKLLINRLFDRLRSGLLKVVD